MKKLPIKILRWVVDQPARRTEEIQMIGGSPFPRTTHINATYKKEFVENGFFLGWGEEPIGSASITRAIIMRSNGECEMTAVCLIQFADDAANRGSRRCRGGQP